MAPILVVAATGAGVWLREWWMPTQFHLQSCVLRTPTAFEVWEGADVTLEMRATFPSGTRDFQQLRVTPDSGQVAEEFEMKWFEPRLGNSGYCASRKFLALRLEGQQKVSGVAELKDANGKIPLVRQEFSLDATQVPRLTPAQAQLDNFKIRFIDTSTSPGACPQFVIHLDWRETSQPFTEPRSQNTGQWQWSGPQGSGSGQGKFFTYQDIMVKCNQKASVMTPGTKVWGWVSINSGWPQKIEFAWPRPSSRANLSPFVKFTQTLMPSPAINRKKLSLPNF